MDALLKIVHFLSLYVMLGSLWFWCVIWRVVPQDGSAAGAAPMAQRVQRGLWLGAGCFVVAGLAEAWRAASQIIDPMTLPGYWDFLTATRYGQMSLLKAALAPLFVASAQVACTWKSRLAQASAALCGLAILGAISYASHAAVRPGLLPLVNDIWHLLSGVAWGGGLLYLALVPWSAMQQASRQAWRLLERFSNVALAAMALVVLSGAITAFLHVYGLVALTVTPYGRVLLGKLLLLGGTLGIAGYNLLILSPALRRQTRTPQPAVLAALLRRCALLTRLEVCGLLGMVGLAAVLTTLPPAERPAQVSQEAWQRPLGAHTVQVTMVPTDGVGTVRFELTHTPAPPVDAPPPWLHLHMRDHAMGTVRREATPVAPGQYTVPGVISMAGTWTLDVTQRTTQNVTHAATIDFEAATGTLEQERTRRLDLAALRVSFLNTVGCVFGLLLSALAVFTLWASRSGRLPLWATPFGVCLLACGGYLSLRVVLVDAYPTTYLPNPLPVTDASTRQGEALFHTHCAVCHGDQGRGDGPTAATLHPPPADLTAAHVDDHTDGDLFWWITHGIAGTAMPAWQDTLAESERWAVIHHLRSLRRVIPPRWSRR